MSFNSLISRYNFLSSVISCEFDTSCKVYITVILTYCSFSNTKVWGRISLSGVTQDIKMGSCEFQCDVPHQLVAQRQVSPVSIYCDGWGVMPLVCGMTLSFLCRSTLVKVQLLQAGTIVI